MQDADGPAPGTALAIPAARAVAVTGAGASLLALAVVHVFETSIPFPPLAVAEAILRATPGGIATFAIEAFGHLAQPVLVVLTTAAFLGATWALGRALPGLSNAVRGGIPIAAFLLGLPLALVGILVFAPNSATVARGSYALVLLGGLVVGAAVTTWRARALAERSATRSEDPLEVSRREVLRAAWLGGAGLTLAWTGLGQMVLGREQPESRALHVNVHEPFPAAPPADPSFDAITGLAPRVTRANDFYTIDTAIFDPIVDEQTWSLEIGGLVDRPFELAYDELLAQPGVSFASTLECISNEVGGDLISTGRWTGIQLRTLLERAGIGDGSVEVVSTSVDGFADSIPLGVAMRETSIVAVGLDGSPLPTAHGFPARLLIPGRYGMKQPKWLGSIELVDRPFEGYWEQRGWSRAAIVKTMSRIDAAVADGPERMVAGVAFAGDRGISRVEVSTDGGRSWTDAEIEPALSPLSWRRWRHRFTPVTAVDGSTLVIVRGTDGEGEVQTQTVTSPHPDGSSGYDRASV